MNDFRHPDRIRLLRQVLGPIGLSGKSSDGGNIKDVDPGVPVPDLGLVNFFKDEEKQDDRFAAKASTFRNSLCTHLCYSKELLGRTQVAVTKCFYLFQRVAWQFRGSTNLFEHPTAFLAPSKMILNGKRC